VENARVQANLQQKELVVQERDVQIQQLRTELREKDERLEQREAQLQEKDDIIHQKDDIIQGKNADICTLQREVQRLQVSSFILGDNNVSNFTQIISNCLITYYIYLAGISETLGKNHSSEGIPPTMVLSREYSSGCEVIENLLLLVFLGSLYFPEETIIIYYYY
jgi:hypothetical protein